MVTNLTMPCIGLQAIYPDKWTWYHSNDAKTTSLPTTLLQFVQCSTSKVALWWNQKLTNLFLAFNVTSIVLIYTQTKVRPPPPPQTPIPPKSDETKRPVCIFYQEFCVVSVCVIAVLLYDCTPLHSNCYSNEKLDNPSFVVAVVFLSGKAAWWCIQDRTS